jgi:hypothetical protein
MYHVLTKRFHSDRNLHPSYYFMENCMLIACALDNWNEAHLWRPATEERYNITFAEASLQYPCLQKKKLCNVVSCSYTVRNSHWPRCARASSQMDNVLCELSLRRYQRRD